jgi:hypothetical protein
MADLDQQTEEALGWAAEAKKLAVDIPEVSFKDAVTFVASATPIIGDAMAAKEVYDELQKDEPNYYLAGALGGAALVGLVPGLGDAAAKAIKKGATEVFDVAKRVEVDPNAMGSGLGNVKLKPKEPFKKTRSAYRIATQSEDGKLYPLFVNASDEIPVGEWISASVPPVTFKGANGNTYVPSKGAARSKGEKAKATGDMQTIPDAETADKLREAGFSVEKPSKSAPYGKVRAVASRPGFHATTKPVAHHLGPEDLIITSSERDQLLKAGVTPKAFKAKTFNYLDGKLISKKKVAELSPEDKKKVKSQKKYYVKRRAEDQVFVEVDMADDTSEDLLKYMQERGRTDINDKLPSGGSYTYQDGQADAETWVVGGDMKVNRVLSREEAKAAQEAAGVKDLPYRSEIEEILGRKFAKGGLVGEENMYTGQQDSLIATGMADDLMQSEEDQTVKAFALGGLAEDVDPVSGNEVPVGSLPEEVRDDIPAQLSEGEYVVPADVVRYYGVKFFEDLRNDAKMGFSQMQANGRIGGEPMGMEVVEPQDDLDIMFDDSDFEVTDGPDGYAEGGVVTPTDFGVRVPETMEMREYVNAQGNTITIMFFNGMPMSAIPEGYTYVNPEPDTATTGGAVTTAADVPSSSDDGPPVVPSSTVEPTNYKELTPSELQALVEEQRSMTQDVIAGIGGIVNPILGIAMKIGMWHTSRQVTKELERRIADPENADLKGQYAELLEYHESDKDSYYNRIMDTIEGKERDKLPFDIEAADPAAIEAAIEEGLAAEEGYAPDDFEGLTTGEVVPLGALEPVAAGFVPSPEPVANKPYTPNTLEDEFGTGNIYTAGSDAAGIAERKRIKSASQRAKAYAVKKREERQRKIDSLEAQISAKGSLARAAADKGDDNDSHKTMMKAAATKQRNKAKGLGAQTKKGSTAGSKSGYFD